MKNWQSPVRKEAPTPSVHSFDNKPSIFSASKALASRDAPTPSRPPPKYNFSAVFSSRSTTTLTSADGSRSATFVGHHDVTKMPQRGKVRVESDELSPEDVDRATGLVAKGVPDSGTSLSVLRRYEEFRKLNPNITSHGLGILGFCAQQVRPDGVGPGAARNMAQHLLTTLRMSNETIENCPLVNAMLLGLDREYAERGAQHAIDINEDEALDFMSRVKRVDVRAALWLMLTCGARLADLLRLADEQLAIDLAARRLRIVFKVTKNRTTIGEKYDVSFPFMITPDAEVIKLLSNGHKLPGCDAINRILKQAKFKIEGERSITTYSFRRVFEHRVIEWYTDNDGITEWTKVIAWTQHQDEKALKGHYNKVTMLKVPKSKALPVVPAPVVITTLAVVPPDLPPAHEPMSPPAVPAPLVWDFPQAPDPVRLTEKRSRTVSGARKKLVQPCLTKFFQKN